jgi:MATE family multidrug resistance protein
MNALALTMLPMGVAFIVQSFAAQFHGSGEHAPLRRHAWYGLAIAAIAQLAAFAAVPLIPRALGALDYTPAVRALMTSFLTLRLMATGATVGIEALSGWYAGQNRTRPGSVANVVLMVVNVPLNVWFIYGGLGLAALGVRGSALASVVATWVAFAWLLGLFLFEGRRAPRSTWLWREFTRVVRFGLPGGVNWFLEFAAFMFFVDVVFTRLGTVALAALMVVLQLNSLAFMPAFGIATAGSIEVGNAIGAKRYDAVAGLVRRAASVSLVWMALVGVAYLVAPAPLLSVFARGAGGETAAMIHVGVQLLWVSVAWQLFDALSMTLAEALRAAGDTTWPMWVRLAISWLLFVPATLATVHYGGGPVASLLWVVVYLALLAVVLWWRFRSGRWRTITLIDRT